MSYPVVRQDSEGADDEIGREQSPLRPIATLEVEDDGDPPIRATDYSSLDLRSILSDARGRIFWLGLFLIGLWAAAFVIDAFEHTLQRHVELAHFVPLIIGHGGNAGSQSVGQVIKALAAKEIDPHSQWRVVVKETAVGTLCGVGLGIGLLVAGLATQIVSVHVGWIVGISLLLISLWANLIGAALPLVAARWRVNPALVSAPLMTTIIDSTGLLIYFMVAHLYFSGARYSDVVDRHHSIKHGGASRLT